MSWDIFMPYKQMPSALFSADSALSREEAQGILALANEMGSTRRLYQYTNVAVINCRVLSSSTTEAHHLSLPEDRSPRPKA